MLYIHTVSSFLQKSVLLLITLLDHGAIDSRLASAFGPGCVEIQNIFALRGVIPKYTRFYMESMLIDPT